MKVQEVILPAVAKKISWWQAGEIIGIGILGIHPTSLRRRLKQQHLDNRALAVGPRLRFHRISSLRDEPGDAGGPGQIVPRGTICRMLHSQLYS